MPSIRMPLSAEKSLQTETLTAEKQISGLEKWLIVPPDGTDQADVDWVFGKPKVIKKGTGPSADSYDP